MHATKRLLLLAGLILGIAAFAPVASADLVGPITFEPSQGYVTGDINGQQGWSKTGSLYDVAVASISAFPAASGYGFGSQALRSSDFFTSGSFGDQTFSPGLTNPAGEGSALARFESTFRIGTTQATIQPGLHMSVSPDDGNGGRMSYLRFEDRTNGVHVFFDDVNDPGPVGTVADFVETDIATLRRNRAHTIRFSIRFRNGPGNDVVRIYVDGRREITGTTWENYYRYDPEQTPTGNQVPTTSKMLFRESGDPNPTNVGNGFLVDGLALASSHGHQGNDDDGDDENENGNFEH